MDIVHSLLCNLPPTLKEDITSYEVQIIAEEQQNCKYIEELDFYTHEYKKCIKDNADLISKYVLEKNLLPNQEYPKMINIDEMKNKIQSIYFGIDNSVVQIAKLNIELAKMKESFEIYQKQIRTDAIYQIRQSPIIFAVFCHKCMSIGPPVIPKFPCYDNTKSLTNKCCSMVLCMHCFKTDTGQVCHECHKYYEIFTRNSLTCIPNMLAMKIIDSYIELENSKFMKFFNVPLNPFICSRCHLSFSTLTDLYHHINNDFCK